MSCPTIRSKTLEATKEGPPDKRGNRRLHCKCTQCGREQLVRIQRLLKQETGCARCSSLKTHCGDLTRTFWQQVEYAAKTHNRELSIDMEYAWSVFLSQDKKCALSGTPLVLSSKRGESTASLDRIDSSKGYVKGNVQWVHKLVNRMKSDLDQNEFVSFCKLIAFRNGFSVS